MSLFSNYFFHNLTQKYIYAFGTLLSDLEIQRTDDTGKVLSQIKVPVTFSNKEKYIQRALDDSTHTRKEAITLPRIAYQLTDISYDSNRKLARNETMLFNRYEQQKLSPFSYTPVPYQLTFNVDVIAKTQTEIYQILEQIIPAFVPDVVIKVKAIDNATFDMPVTLGGIIVSDSYDGSFEQRRQLTANLNFTVKTYYFAPVNKREIILDVNIPVHELTSEAPSIDTLYENFNYTPDDFPGLSDKKRRVK